MQTSILTTPKMETNWVQWIAWMGYDGYGDVTSKSRNTTSNEVHPTTQGILLKYGFNMLQHSENHAMHRMDSHIVRSQVSLCHDQNSPRDDGHSELFGDYPLVI